MVARLSLSSHAVTIERRVGGKWSEIVSGAAVLPEEAIRFSAKFGAGVFAHTNKATFTVIDSSGNVAWGPSSYNALVGSGNAYVDLNAPIIPGTYKVIVTGEGQRAFGLFDKGGHDVERTFRVSVSAKPPAHVDAPNGGFSLPGIAGGVGGLFSSPWTIILILGALLALGILI